MLLWYFWFDTLFVRRTVLVSASGLVPDPVTVADREADPTHAGTCVVITVMRLHVPSTLLPWCAALVGTWRVACFHYLIALCFSFTLLQS